MRLSLALTTLLTALLLGACSFAPRTEVMTSNHYTGSAQSTPVFTTAITPAGKFKYNLGSVDVYYKNLHRALDASIQKAGLGSTGTNGSYRLTGSVSNFTAVLRGYSVGKVSYVTLVMDWTLTDSSGQVLWQEQVKTEQGMSAGFNQVKAEQSASETVARQSIDTVLARLKALNLQ